MSAECNKTAILRTRYSKLLSGINVDDLATHLENHNYISSSEKDVILSSLSGIKKHRELCKALAGKGSSKVAILSKVIAEFREKQQQPIVSGESGKQFLDDTIKRKPEGSEVHHDMSRSSSGYEQGCVTESKKNSEAQQHNDGNTWKGRRASSGDEREYVGATTSNQLLGNHQPTIQAKQEIKDVPDPPGHGPLYIGSDSNSDSSASDSECEDEHKIDAEMEAFVVLFYMLITQLQQTLDSFRHSKSQISNHGSYQDEDETATHHDSEEVLENKLDWLSMDVPLEEMRDYFPPEEIKGVTPSPSSPISLTMSVILEAFQQFYERLQQATKENLSESQNAQLIKELKKKHAHLLAKVKDLQKSKVSVENHTVCECRDQQCNPSLSAQQSQLQKLKKEISNLIEKIQTLEPFQTAYTNSEERCKQLVGVTQEWAIECEEKDKLIAVLETQIKQLQEEIDLLQKRVFKYKKHWMATRDREEETTAAAQGGGGNRVDQSQLEEAKLELALRREFQDQVLAEKEEAVETAHRLMLENELLKRENDELRDDNEELRDKVGNLKVNAQAKEPSVREMGALSSENRQLKEKIQQLEKEKTSLSDEVLAYKTYVSELTQTPLNGVGGAQPTSTRPPNPPPRQTARTQAMVTGYTVPTSLRREAARKHQQKPRLSDSGATVIPRGVPPPPLQDDPIIEPHNHHHDNHRHDHDDADTVSTISDDDLSPFTSHSSVLRSGASVAHHLTNGHSHSRGQYLSNRSTDYKSPPVDFTDSPPIIGDLKQFPPATVKSPGSFKSTGDYTQHIRYPNHSGILVRPLHDDEVSLQGAEGEQGASNGHPPNFYDPTALSPAKIGVVRSQTPNQPEAVLLPGSALLTSDPLRGRECPKCQHVWYTLREEEFQSHVAGCFR